MLTPKIAGILLMGGEGIRFESPLPKQFHHISGKPIFLYAVQRFLSMKEFDQIILAVPANWENKVAQEIKHLEKRETIKIVAGGRTRQESSYLALLACRPQTEFVVIHDGVRPFVSLSTLKENIEQVLLHQAVDTCIPSADTLVHIKQKEWIHSIPCRENFLRGQTPQSFAYPLILAAHKQALEDQHTNSSDDCSLVLRLGQPVKIVMGSEFNLKITTELDLFLAEKLLHHSLEEVHSPLWTQDLQGKIFAVTGATGGIGKVICKKLLELGAIPLEISKTASSFPADLTQYAEAEKTFAAIHEKYGPLDGLINSIGALSLKDFSLLSEEEINAIIASNLTSVIYCCRLVQLKSKGHIINISSSSYSRGRKDYPIYSASKAALVNFTQGLAEARPDLHIHAVVPQRTNTPLRTENFPLEQKESLLQPEEIAQRIILLLKNHSMTGSILEIRKRYSLEMAMECCFSQTEALDRSLPQE